MKSYYELSEKDLKKYRSEFLKLDYSKKYTKLLINVIKGFFLMIIVFAIIGIIESIINKDEVFADLIWLYIDILLGIIAVTIICCLTKYNKNFKKWLKTKHNIES